MIEANETAGKTPALITTSMVLEDLSNGIDRKGIQTKYGLKLWEVTQMFEHPTLKGKRPSKKRKLSFNFIDDTNPVRKKELEEALAQQEEVDPNQVTIEQVIEEEESITPPTIEDTLEIVKEQQMEEMSSDYIDNNDDEEEDYEEVTEEIEELNDSFEL